MAGYGLPQMSSSLASEGFEIRRGVLGEAQLLALRAEVDRVARVAGSACVRHVRAYSELLQALSVSATLRSLLPPGLSPVRSLLFDKTAAENWPVSWHQDLTIAVVQERPVEGYGPWSFKDGWVHVQPPVAVLEHMVTLRLHLDDTPASNGALRVIPGSHRHGRLSSEQLAARVDQPAVTCECQAGDVLLMSPLILHASRRSESPARRRVLHFEYARLADLDPNLEWFEVPGRARQPG